MLIVQKALSSNLVPFGLQELKAPVDEKIIDNRGSGVESIISFLNEDDDNDDKKKEDLLADDDEETGPDEKNDDDEPVKKKDKDKEEDEDEDDEKKLELSEEDEDEIPDDEELDELITPAPRKAILKKYPTLFKDFPHLEKAMYREQEYTEIIPTISEAKEIVERVKNFDKLESEVFSGSSESLLKAVKETDPKAFDKIVDNYLPNLQKVDQSAYYHVVGNVIKSTIIGMAREAQNSQNDNLKAAAQILNQFVFGTSDFVPPASLTNNSKNEEVDSEKAKLQQERTEYIKERFDTSVGDLSGRVNNILKSTISQHIDPRGVMTEYVKKTAVRESLENLEDLIGQDTRFIKMKDKLWEKAVESNFSQKSLNAIRNAYLSKAKTLLPSVIQKSRNDALKGLGKKVKDDDDNETRPRTSLSRSAKSQDGREEEPRTKKGDIPRGMSNRDFIMSD